MRKQVEAANRYLTHNIRHSLVHVKLLQRQLDQLARDIEKTLNIYREMIDDLVIDCENRLSDGKIDKDE